MIINVNPVYNHKKKIFQYNNNKALCQIKLKGF